jgi:hypothetical protein
MTVDEGQSKNIIISVDKNVKKDTLPIYSVNKQIIAGGKWSLDNKNIYIIDDKGIKTNIILNKNIYEFGNNTISYNNNGDCGEIIVDNYTDELKICFNRDTNGYLFKRNNDVIAEITQTKDSSDSKISTFELNMKDTDPKYKTLFIVAFIIFHQNDIDINTSFDTIF